MPKVERCTVWPHRTAFGALAIRLSAGVREEVVTREAGVRVRARPLNRNRSSALAVGQGLECLGDPVRDPQGRPTRRAEITVPIRDVGTHVCANPI